MTTFGQLFVGDWFRYGSYVYIKISPTSALGGKQGWRLIEYSFYADREVERVRVHAQVLEWEPADGSGMPARHGRSTG